MFNTELLLLLLFFFFNRMVCAEQITHTAHMYGDLLYGLTNNGYAFQSPPRRTH
jgi:hypothetical protein